LNADIVLKILLLPVIIFLWGIGWTLAYSGDFVYKKSKKTYHKFLNDIKGED